MAHVVEHVPRILKAYVRFPALHGPLSTACVAKSPQTLLSMALCSQAPSDQSSTALPGSGIELGLY